MYAEHILLHGVKGWGVRFYFTDDNAGERGRDSACTSQLLQACLVGTKYIISA
jgi:hypothetical protein